MSNILLLEPNYKNKYPPVGLMKLSTYHKTMLNDHVRFSKGQLPEALNYGKWDRVYVTTLFTFEWDETISAIKYALTLVDTPDKVIVGGIAATLMPDQIFLETGIKPISGLLNMPGKIGLPNDECIDQLIPDYSILDDTQYIYPYHDAYFLSATKGCGMRCGFCAVQTLEPVYVPYLDIKEKIKKIDELYGQKRDLLLMDNNVLRSTNFDQIIDDIISVGFYNGSTYINSKTGKVVHRYVDFNQGLDANLLTPEKAHRLGQISLKPARIAFDHIEDKATYERVIRLCAENGVTELSNYILYNSEDFSGKGKAYHADTPEDLYERLRFTLDLKTELNSTREEDNKISIFSFPMRYVPLSARERGYVGSKWNPKFLRAVQCMLIPTQGKGVGSQSFFEADFGCNSEDFIRFLCMPEKLIASRGDFIIGGRGRISETDEQATERKRLWIEKQSRIAEWNRMFSLLNEEKNEFIEAISDNEYLPEKLMGLRTDLQKKLYLHYLTEPRIFTLLGLFENGSPTLDMIKNYIQNEFPIIYKGLVKMLVTSESQKQFMFKNFMQCFGREGLQNLVRELKPNKYRADEQMAIWAKVCKSVHLPLDFELVRLYGRFIDLGVFDKDTLIQAEKAIENLDNHSLGVILFSRFNDFRSKITDYAKNEQGEKALLNATDVICKSIQLKLEDILEGF